MKETVTVEADGYAKWFKVSEADSEAVWTIKLPENGSYFVYDEDFKCLATSLEKNLRKAVNLSPKGYIVFVGEPGSVFEIEK